jgi:hypothetical protein
MAQYLLLLYHDGAQGAMFDPKFMQEAVAKYQAWGQRLRDKAIYLGSNKLENEPGKVLRGTSGKVLVTDGPYSETKEWLGGYYLIEAPNYDAAIDAARDCPHLEYGGTIEVREVDARAAAANARRAS